MQNHFEVILTENKVKRNQEGHVTHHSLSNGHFLQAPNGRSHGYLTFAGHNLDKSTLLADIRVFCLEFQGESDGGLDGDAWAAPLRIDVLDRLSGRNNCWYLAFYGDIPERESLTGFTSINDALQKTLLYNKQLPFAIVDSEKQAYVGANGFVKKLFFECPNQLLSEVISHYWESAYPGFPIEGYCLPHGQINLLKKWGARPHDDHLLQEVMETVDLAFYTFPTENRHFVFVTNKLTLAELANRINLKDLQERAYKMSSL